MYEYDICNEVNEYIDKDFDDYLEDIQISVKLKQVLFIEDSSNYCAFSEEVS